MVFRRRSLLNISGRKISHGPSVIVSNSGRGPPGEVDPIMTFVIAKIRIFKREAR